MNTKQSMTAAIVGLAMYAIALPALPHDSTLASESSKEFLESLAVSMGELDRVGLFDQLEQPGFGSESTSGDFVHAFIDQLQQIGITNPDDPFFGTGDLSLEYDVILQPGHFLLERCCNNRTGTEGTVENRTVYEQDFVAFVSLQIAKILTERNVSVLVIPADKNRFSSKLQTKVFLAIHLDGANKQCTSGSSLGYGMERDVLGAHAVGLALSRARGIGYDEFLKDNFTAALKDYYAFARIQSSVFEAVVELAELSCPEQALEVIDATPRIINNLASMLKTIVEMDGT